VVSKKKEKDSGWNKSSGGQASDLSKPLSKMSFEEIVSTEDPTQLYKGLEQIGAGYVVCIMSSAFSSHLGGAVLMT